MTAPSRPTHPTPPLVRVFTQRFSCPPPRGARLARQLALVCLHDWGVPEGTAPSADAGLVVAELASNAATHGRVVGRDFELRMTLLGGDDPHAPGVLRLEVSDPRRDRRPAVRQPACQAESGYGLRIVDGLAADWGVVDRIIGKTVWAELAVGDSASVRTAGPASGPGR
ncbi:ATP-binding protein [Streptomyces sp. NPDC001373]|uniref:ATP-binding protein n=1 Tax=Streptomyces sp. NPDC001373 TaxID=3364565 RepID=UPI0036B21787